MHEVFHYQMDYEKYPPSSLKYQGGTTHPSLQDQGGTTRLPPPVFHSWMLKFINLISLMNKSSWLIISGSS